MKNKSKFALELFITLIVASLLSSVIAITLGFTIMNLGGNTDALTYVNTIASSAWGIFVGYKLNTLLRQHR
jgi:hypothetical protein